MEILGPDGWMDISSIVAAFSYTASLGSPLGETHVEFIPNPVVLESVGALDRSSLDALTALVDSARTTAGGQGSRAYTDNTRATLRPFSRERGPL